MLHTHETTTTRTERSPAQSRISDETLDVLQDLVHRIESAIELEQSAADAASSDEMIALASKRGGRRARFAADLRAMLRERLAEPSPSETLLGRLHADWALFAHFVDGDKPNALLTELRRRDEALIGAYEQAIQQTDNQMVARLLWAQHKQLVAEQLTLDRLAAKHAA